MEDILPRFFKIMIPGFETELRLPPLVSKKLVREKPEEVMLTSQKGSWKVTVHQCEGGRLWFTKGWDEFVRQHGLDDGHMAVFEHTGSFHFNVMLFDFTCCEKDFHDKAETNNKRGRTWGKNVCTGQGNPCFINDSSLAPSAKIDHKNVFPSLVKIQEHINRVSVKLEVDEDEVPSPAKLQKHDLNRYSVKGERNDDGAPIQVKIQKHDAHDKKWDTKGKKEPMVVNVSSPEQCLQFVASMKPYNLRGRSPYFHIPAAFCVANGLYQNARISLKGPRNEQQVSLKVCKGGKTIYAVITRGWPEFKTGNNLKEGDSCIFKLRSTGSSSDGIVFDVEVLPAAT